MSTTNPFTEIENRLNNIEAIIKSIANKQNENISIKKYYTPKEFSEITSIPYSTVVNRCKEGKYKAFQNDFNCSWYIDAKELDKFDKQAEENLF